MVMTILMVLYLLFSFGVAMLLRSKKRSFWAVFLLSLGLTPIVVGTLGLVFSDDETTKP